MACETKMDVVDIVDEPQLSFPINTKDNLPWVEKYRPKTIDEIISHEVVRKVYLGDKFNLNN